jgi:hypothetical protein
MRDFTRLTMFLLTFFATASLLVAQQAPMVQQTKAEFLGLETSVPEHPAFKYQQNFSRDVLLEEGFDDVFPPAGWTVIEHHPTNNWIQTNPSNPDLNFNNVDPSSLFSAMVPWDAASLQDEWLLTPEINASETPVTLEFYFGISGSWLSGATLKVHVTTDGGDNFTELLDVIDMVDPGANWAWYFVNIDVTDYAAGPFHIAWQYIGMDGDLCGLDNVRISEGGSFLYVDDFESYNVGDGIAASNENWILWPASGVTDVLVSNEQSNSPSQSLKVGTGPIDDVVLLLGNKTSGVYGLDFYIYVPEGAFSGYYNIQHFEAPGVEWASQVWFASNGDGWVDAGGPNAAIFTYPKGAWVLVSQIFDLDEDWTELWIGGELVHEWPFSYQANSPSGTKMLGGLNLYPAAQAGTTPQYYIDDVSYYIVTPGSADPMIDLNVSQINTSLQEGNSTTINRTITNVGEGTLVYDIVPSFNEPTMRKSAAMVPAGADVKNFDGVPALSPTATPGELFPNDRTVTLNYDGENNSAIGLVNPNQWRAAARFPAEMVRQYNGMYLEQVMVYINDMANAFKIQVYGMGSLVIPGAGPLLHEQEFTAIAGAWNTITLNEPVYIDGTDIWIGYWIDQTIGGIFPAGVDNGPPIADGRWISTGAGWGYLVETLPYNWNIRGVLNGDAGPVWLSLSPSSGELGAQESDVLAITIDAAELDPLNVYRGRLHVRSNDPVNDYLNLNVVVAVLVGLNEVGEQAYVATYPNPTSDQLNIKANTEILQVRVSNLLGQLVYSTSVNKAETIINLSGLETGIYFVIVETTSGTTTQRVMVK